MSILFVRFISILFSKYSEAISSPCRGPGRQKNWREKKSNNEKGNRPTYIGK